jgi:hypothetical protein
MSSEQKELLSIALYELLHGNKEEDLEGLVEVLSFYKLSKCSIMKLIS